MGMALESEPSAVKRSVRLLRVSTSAQTDTDYDMDRNEGNSIDTQRKAAIEKEQQLGSVNVGEYVEPGYSGQSIEKRPFFKALMKRIVEQRDVDYVVIYMRSRVFRNYVEAAIVKQQLERLGVRIVSAKEDFGEGYMAEAMEAMTDVFNWLTVKVSGQDIKNKMANKAKNGGTIGRAKVGYRNERILIEGHKVNTIAIDDERAPYVRMAFELFAQGEETVDSLHTKLTLAGFRMPGTQRWPEGRAISKERLRTLLRDKYYAGVILHDGIEYPGRHEALTDLDTYERVQRILDSHGGSGSRQRTHNHYLKGLLWCGRCKRRLIIDRATGRGGGEYFYWLCRGRQDGICDLPYFPVEVLEEAVVRFYAEHLRFDPQWVEQLHAAVEAAANVDRSLPEEMRAQYAKRLEALDRKESYFLDLAGEEGWPKEKLREKIQAVRQEATGIRRTIQAADERTDVSRRVLQSALALLERPSDVYQRGSEQIRVALNAALLTRLYVDGERITGHDLREPFDKLAGLYGEYVINRNSALAQTSHEHLAARDAKGAAPVSGNSASHVTREPFPPESSPQWPDSWSKSLKVDLTWTYSNRLDLAELLERTRERIGDQGQVADHPLRQWGEDRRPSVTAHRPAVPRRVVDRLGEAAVQRMIAHRAAGMPLREIAERYEVSISTVKRITATRVSRDR